MDKLSDLDVDTDLLLFLELEERTEDPCEHTAHAEPSQRRWHSGPGEWLMAIHRTCGCIPDTTTKLICDRFKTSVIDINQPTYCGDCGTALMVEYTVLGRKGVDF